MLVEVIRSFDFAHEGIRVVRYVPGVQDLPEEVAGLAIREGWARQKMESGAPENKMEPGPPSNKGRSILHRRAEKK